MDEDQKFVVMIVGIIAIVTMVVTAAIITDDIAEKRMAFSKGLCQVQGIGSSNWYWNTCKEVGK